MIHMDPTQSALLVAIAGKLLIYAADTMPPPPGNCGFWCRWSYDFLQRIATNSDKVGGVRK